jgi:4-hydroxythreonine-4-phosphate dehydrogenase
MSPAPHRDAELQKTTFSQRDPVGRTGSQTFTGMKGTRSMETLRSPLLAITMGDPAGCGPEVIAKAVADDAFPSRPRVVCVGDATVMERAFSIVGKPYRVHVVEAIQEAVFEPGSLDVLDLNNVDLDRLQLGRVQAEAGRAAYEYITTAIDLALAGRVDAVVTSAINKEALHAAGYKYDGHTEIFAARTGSKRVTMMLAAGDFRVTHVSTHCSLKQAVECCKTGRILEVIRLTYRGLKQMGLTHPYLAVAGLNPHSGEGGLFGREEIEQIQPAIDQARSEGIHLYSVPLPPDTVFVRLAEGKEFDAVIAQYHDQGHIAAKLVDFWGGVNITLGLPIIRTSVDHGTAFDIAGSGRASPKSLVNAVEYARLMAIHATNSLDI